MEKVISHDRQEETLEAKARWFQSLSLSERMDLLCAFTDLILANNPHIVEQKDAQPIAGRIRVLSKHKVKYVVIGGIAAVLHGVPRATFDLDILIEATPSNAQRLLDALLEAKLGTASLISANELLAHEITIFKDRVRIDVQTTTPGLRFEDAWQNRETMEYQGQTFYVVSRDDLIASERASGRTVDLEDARLLELGNAEQKT